MDISDGSSRLFSNNPTEQPPQWLGDEDDVLWLRVNDGGETQVWIGSTLGEKKWVALFLWTPLSGVLELLEKAPLS